MATTKLTDTHLVILSNAAQQPDNRVLPVPASVVNKAGSATRALNALLRRKLIAEVPASPADVEWGRSDDGERLTLAITNAGLDAISIQPEDTEAEGAEAKKVVSGATNQRRNASAKRDAESEPSFRDGTKGAALVNLLRGKDGATLPDLMDASGWQAHSVRGFLSGTLKKKHGLTIESEKSDDGVRRYRIAA